MPIAKAFFHPIFATENRDEKLWQIFYSPYNDYDYEKNDDPTGRNALPLRHNARQRTSCIATTGGDCLDVCLHARTAQRLTARNQKHDIQLLLHVHYL